MSRTAGSQICAGAGVALLIYSALAPSEWYPAVALFTGLALLCISHYLTPCLDRIAVWRKQLLK